MEPDEPTKRLPKFLSFPLWAGILAYLGLFLAFRPTIAGIEDEQGFINQTIFWSRGGLSAEGAGLPTTLGDLILVGGRHLPARHPGRSLAALPFYLVGGYEAVFLSGAFLHVVLTLLAAATFRRLGHSPWWALLVLFHPTLLIYSRTVMADASAGMGLLVSVYALSGAEKPRFRDLVTAGLGVSLAAVMRHHAAAALPAIAAAAWARSGTPKAGFVVAAASAVGALPMIVFNLVAYGSIFDPFSAGRGTFGLQFLPQQVPFYIEALSLFWPLMFIAPALVRAPSRWVILGICGTFLALLGCYYFHDTARSRLQTAVIGLRLMQVALPAWIIGYGAVLGRIAAEIRLPALRDQRVAVGTAWAFVILGTVLTTGIFVVHQRRLEDLDRRRQEVIRLTPDGGYILYEGVVSKLLGIYREDQPEYLCHATTLLGKYCYSPEFIRKMIAAGGPVYMIFSGKNPGDQPSRVFMDLAEKLDAVPIESDRSIVQAWKPRRNLPEAP